MKKVMVKLYKVLSIWISHKNYRVPANYPENLFKLKTDREIVHEGGALRDEVVVKVGVDHMTYPEHISPSPSATYPAIPQEIWQSSSHCLFILPHSHLQFASTRVESVVKEPTLEYPVEMYICIVQQLEGSIKTYRMFHDKRQFFLTC